MRATDPARAARYQHHTALHASSPWYSFQLPCPASHVRRNLLHHVKPFFATQLDDAILTYDLGTTRIKVALFDLRGRLIGQRAARHREYREGNRAWQDADGWWSDAVRLTKELLTAKPRRVVAISVSGRGGAAVFIGRDGTVIGQPWSDRRHAAELAVARRMAQGRRASVELRRRAAREEAVVHHQRADSGAATAPRAVREGFPDLSPHRARRSPIERAARTPPSGMPRALDHTDSANLVPNVALPWDIAGPLDPRAAQALDLPAGIPVVVGAHDGICANVGAGAGHPGAYAITLGTHAVVRAIRSDVPEGSFRFYDLPPDRHVIGGNAVMGGRAADWFLDLVFGANDRSRARHFVAMDAAAGAVPAGSGGVRFLPFLSGQVAPESRPGASAVFTGLRTSHDRSNAYRAVLEGGAFAIRSIFDQIHAWCGEPSMLRLTGSGARSRVWCEILANTIGRAIEASDEAVEGRGAAVFAAVALGLYPDYDAAAAKLVPVKHALRTRPDSSPRSTPRSISTG